MATAANSRRSIALKALRAIRIPILTEYIPIRSIVQIRVVVWILIGTSEFRSNNKTGKKKQNIIRLQDGRIIPLGAQLRFPDLQRED